MKKCYPLFMLGMMAYVQNHAQVHIAGPIAIRDGATLRVAGDLESSRPVSGTGTLLLRADSGPQHLNLNGREVSRLTISNSHGVFLSGDAQVGLHLGLEKGGLHLGDHDLIMAPETAIAPAAGTAVVTTGEGVVTASRLAPGESFDFPVSQSGEADDLTPARVTNLSDAAADISVQVKSYMDAHGPLPNAGSGIDRSWLIYGSGDADISIALTHNEQTEGSRFDRDQAFITRQEWEGGALWSVGIPGPGTQNGSTHTGVAALPGARGTGAWFSKSSDTETSLGSIAAGITAHASSGDAVSIWPNPFRNTLTFRIQSGTETEAAYMLADLRGSILRSGTLPLQQGENLFHMNGTGLSEGYYLLTFPAWGQTFRIIKQ